MSKVVGIHGIANEQFGRRQIADSWTPALLDGVELITKSKSTMLDLDIAYYGHLYRTNTSNQKTSKRSHPTDQLNDDEIDFLLSSLEEVTEPDRAEESADVSATKGKFPSLPGRLIQLLGAIDSRFGPSAGKALTGTLRQVRTYLESAPLRNEIDRILQQTITSSTELIIAHSLGSVVALEFLRTHPETPVRHLLTIGSPLGLKTIQSRLPTPWHGTASPSGLPKPISSWTNIRDPRDPVTCAGTLTNHWPGLIEKLVDNGDNPHAATRYLGKSETGKVVVDAIQTLS